MSANPPELQEISALEAQAVRALEAGREAEAVRCWERLLALAPRHVRALTGLGQHAFRRGDAAGAQALCRRVVEADGSDPQQWVSLAVTCKVLGDEPGEEAAIQKALEVDPSDLLALLMRGNLLERKGSTHLAASAYGAAATVAPPLQALHPDLKEAVRHAMTYRDDYDRRHGAFLDQALQAIYREFEGEDLRRFRDSVDLMVGRKRRYDSLPTNYFFPRLPAIEFFDRGDFPWLDAFEAATDAVRGEFLAVLESEAGFVPYVTYRPGQPLHQWAELNNSPRWSAFHLVKDGAQVAENAARCPQTLALLAGAPQPDQPGRTPNAMFSLLKPRTRIPPHTGVTNVRLVAHLPLIIPEGCNFRVGNEVRDWVPGKAWIFDDTIEHEAWNGSDSLRVILMFDVWHPHLTDAERAMITATSAAMNAFRGHSGGFDL